MVTFGTLGRMTDFATGGHYSHGAHGLQQNFSLSNFSVAPVKNLLFIFRYKP